MMKLMTMKQYMKMSKPALIRKITKALRVMPKVKLARLCYNITKSKLPRFKTFPSLDYRITETPEQREKRYLAYTPQQKRIRKKRVKSITRKALPYNGRIDKRRKKKRKFSRKQLAAQRLFAKRARAGTLRKRRRR